MPIVHPLDPDIPAIFDCAQAGCSECLGDLLKRHEGLVCFVISRQASNGVSFEDLMQEGRIALWRAIAGFDPGFGVPFSSFAGIVIERQIWAVARREKRCQGRGYLINPPDAYLELEQGLWLAQVRQRLTEGMTYLTARQRQVIALVYGLGDSHSVAEEQAIGNLAEAGRLLGISRERVRQLRNQALSILRLPAFSLSLRWLSEQDSREAYLRSRQLTRAWLRTRGPV